MKEIYTALITPFNDENKVDFIALKLLIEDLILQGNNSFVLCGTTGEVSALTFKEKKQIIQFAKYHFEDSKFIIGITGNCTNNVVSQILDLQYWIGDCPIMVVVPYYNKPNQKGLYEHFSSIAKCTQNDIILYNVPSRCSCNLEDDTIIKLATNHKNIIGLKQAGNYKNIRELKKNIPFFKVYIGNDDLLLEGLEQNVDGIISVCSHVCFSLISEIINSKSKEKDIELKRISKLVFIESSPSPIKYMLYKKGLITNKLRLPLVEISDLSKKEIDKHMI